MPPAHNQPDFPAPAPQQPRHDPYDFFLNKKPAKKNFIPTGQSTTKKILFGLAALMFFGIAIMVLVSVIFGGDDGSEPLVAVVAEQKELVRVAQDGTKNVNSSDLLNFAVTADASLTSAQQALVKYIGTTGKKVDTKKILLPVGSDTTTKALAAAITSNTYDVTFKSIMQTNLDKYVDKLGTAANAATTTTGRQLLNKQAAEAELLIQQLNP